MADAENASIYSERYVAFIDISGFSNIVRHSVGSPMQATELAAAFDRMHQRWSNPALQLTHDIANCDFRVQSFSDCTVMSTAATPAGLHYLLLMVTQFARDLMGIGLPVRGGVAKGLLYHADNGVFGPAFLDAYAMERDIADFPRIIVDQATHKDFEAGSPPATWDVFSRPALRYDDDGPVFVDVLSAFRITEGHIPERVLINGRAIRASIQNQVNSTIYTPAHYRKARWLAIYWNTVRDLKVIDLLEPITLPIMRDYQKRDGS
jgi:hypothetical protein